ncbi:hypothetical protein FPQ18DRAFT_384398 [Pyronema domesticum]|nr:hypothetical protein FPQ18DRAFT_384398 [Pyronema domesticum]
MAANSETMTATTKEPVYVNPKQFDRNIKRRIARRKLEGEGRHNYVIKRLEPRLPQPLLVLAGSGTEEDVEAAVLAFASIERPERNDSEEDGKDGKEHQDTNIGNATPDVFEVCLLVTLTLLKAKRDVEKSTDQSM